MKVWFDISNSPHVLMWFPMITELKSKGYDILITARPLANTISLLNQYQLNYTVIGHHYGKSLIKKIAGYPIRVYQLWKYLKTKNINLSVSQSSFHSPLVAFLLGVPSIYTNDNEHALGNFPAFLFASRVFIPENMKLPFYLQFFKYKITIYPGIKEGLYLWKKAINIMSHRGKHDDIITRIYVRPEPSTAQYYGGKVNFLNDLLKELDNQYPVSILTRTKEQYEFYSRQGYKNILVPADPIPFDRIATDCLLFIGAGGSMTREMAIMGLPTVSVYQDTLLGVDQFLVNIGKMIHDTDLNFFKVKKIIANHSLKINENSLIHDGELAYHLIYSTIDNFKN